jgi:hypothetical protein
MDFFGVQSVNTVDRCTTTGPACLWWLVGPCPPTGTGTNYCIGSNFWKFYLIKTGFTICEPVTLVKVFRLFRLEWILLVFWKFYLIKIGFTICEPVPLVKVFRLFRLEWILLVFRLLTQEVYVFQVFLCVGPIKVDPSKKQKKALGASYSAHPQLINRNKQSSPIVNVTT